MKAVKFVHKLYVRLLGTFLFIFEIRGIKCIVGGVYETGLC